MKAKFIDIENTDESYNDLLIEIQEHQKNVNRDVQYILTGLIAGKKLSDQEHRVFVARVLHRNKFEDIAFEMGLSQSSVKTYYTRSINKLNAIALKIDFQIKRK